MQRLGHLGRRQYAGMGRLALQWRLPRVASRSFGGSAVRYAGEVPPVGEGAEEAATEPGPVEKQILSAFKPLQDNLYLYPTQTVMALMGTEMVGIFLTHSCIKAAGVAVSVEFAIAYAISKVLRKFRFPLDVLAARSIIYLLPGLGQLRFSFPLSAGKDDSGAVGWLKKTSDKMVGVMNKYGIPYLIGSRCMGLATVLGLYGSLRMGLDVSSLTNYFGYTDTATGEVQDSALGSWSAAVVVSSALYPLSLILAGNVAPLLPKFGGDDSGGKPRDSR